MSLLFSSLAFLLLITTTTTSSPAATPLRRGYYSATCPPAEFIVREVMRKSLLSDPRSAASVMRFQFHDCFVNGCDGSMLMDDTDTMLGEKLSLSNIDSLRSYEVVDDIKAELEKACPGVVSCADIIIMASRDAVSLNRIHNLIPIILCFFNPLFSVYSVFVNQTGGPNWEVKLGRLDSLTASQADADAIMPSPRANATMLIDLFARYNLSVKDLVALSGSHSIGKGRCFSIQFRLYNQSAIEPHFREKLMDLCPMGGDDNVTVGLDSTPVVFDNAYFRDLVGGRGFLNSDQTLYTFPATRRYVERYSRDEEEFFRAFVEGMVKMGDLQSGRPGEVRRNCRVANGGRPPAPAGFRVDRWIS
ncbi:unnamed protein product [Linum tenue]|uniref:Peroxidase n=1 Tax=Linum tenue TaxID=586396 RepID=A0AAV0KJC0_9ROSI|nr:unnamed protein product [Linum tenue]